MANTEEQNSGVVSAFRVPKRNLNIGGIDKKNRPFNPRFNRPIKRNEIFEKLISDGIISAVSFGSKNCFFTKELSEENKTILKEKIDADNKLAQLKYSKVDIDEKGWWTIYTSTKDGIKPSKELSDAIDTYHSFSDPEDKNCLTMYGEIGFSVDFSKLNMVADDEGISFPYGILFFSDSKSFINQFSAKCAVLPRRLEKARNNAYIYQIEDWTDARISGSFRSSGHFVIFFVSNVETITGEDGEQYTYPKVSLYDIEVLLNRDKDGTISAVGIGKVESSEVTANSIAKDAYGSEINYLIKNAFGKHSVASIASSRFVSDYIYLIGDDPRYYDLSLFNSDTVDERKKNSEKFSSQKKVETTQEKSEEHSDNKPKKKAVKKNNKKNETGSTETEKVSESEEKTTIAEDTTAKSSE